MCIRDSSRTGPQSAEFTLAEVRATALLQAHHGSRDPGVFQEAAMSGSGMTWRCPCGQENWNTRNRCRACQAYYAPDWAGWEKGRFKSRRGGKRGRRI
eukprot:8603897-Alexandrium_andersonii.AAC.1